LWNAPSVGSINSAASASAGIVAPTFIKHSYPSVPPSSATAYGSANVSFVPKLLDESGYWQAIATYRYSTKESFDEDDELPSELARRISAQFAREHPGAGPINVLRREPSIVKE
jgi:hypothetical protein